VSYQSYLDAIERQTGKTPQQIIELALQKGFSSATKSGEVVAWLKADLQLGHGYAAAMAGVIKNGPLISDKHVGTSGPHSDASTMLRLDGIAHRDDL
jgi:hypothetical protein